MICILVRHPVGRCSATLKTLPAFFMHVCQRDK